MKKRTKYLKMLVDLLVTVLIIFAICYFGPKVLAFFLPFVIGWIISMIANPLVKFLERKLKIVRKHSSVLIIICSLAAIVAVLYFGAVKIGTETVDFVSGLPELYEKAEVEFKEIGNNLQGVYDRLPGNIQKSLNELSKDLNTYIAGAIQAVGAPTVSAAGRFAKNLPSLLISIIVTLLSSYFFIAEREEIVENIKKITPDSVQDRVSLVIANLKTAVGGYFKAQFKIMGVVFVILLIGFLILKVDYAVLLAFLISFLDFLPFFGTGTALIPWALFHVLSGDYQMAVGLLIIYAASQLIRQLIQPKMVGDSMGLKPLPTLLFLFIGYRVEGVIGMIVAVPLGMILINLYRAGVFDRFIGNLKEIVNDVNEFRKID